MSEIEIKKLRDKLGVSQEKLAEMLGVHLRTIQNWEAGHTIPKAKHALLRKVFSEHTSEGTENEEIKPKQRSFSELKRKTFTTHLEVKVVTIKARAGYSESYYADEYLEDMPTILIEADKEYHGKYLAFEVGGDSMEPDYHEKDVVIGREIRRDLWRGKLHYNDWDFIIAHGTQGIMLKQIIDHNVETGEITCHSVNTEQNPDFTLNLREVAFLYNVVEHRIPGKNKLRYR